MATVIGQLPEFNPESESLTTYVERVKLFIEANGIEDARKVAVLLSVIGGKTYALLRNLLSPTDPKTKSFDEIVAELEGHYEPKPIVIAERFHFHKRIRTKPLVSQSRSLSPSSDGLQDTASSRRSWKKR